MPDRPDQTYFLDGSRFTTLEEFYDELERELLGDSERGRNLDALNDVLHGDFGEVPAKFALVWQHAELSRSRLNHLETARQATATSRALSP